MIATKRKTPEYYLLLYSLRTRSISAGGNMNELSMTDGFSVSDSVSPLPLLEVDMKTMKHISLMRRNQMMTS